MTLNRCDKLRGKADFITRATSTGAYQNALLGLTFTVIKLCHNSEMKSSVFISYLEN